MTAEQSLHRLVHRAALDPDGWTPLVEALLDRFRGEGGGLNVADPATGKSLQSLDYGISEARHAQYYGEVFRFDPRIPAMAAMASATAFCDSELLAPEAIDRHPFYAWQAEFGYRHTLFLKLLHDPRHLGAIAITRRIATGAPTGDELAFARQLAPAIAHAADVSRRISALQQLQAATDIALGAGASAFAILDRAGALVHASPAFARMLARRDGLLLLDGHLRARFPGSAGRLARILGEAIAGGNGAAMPLERTSGASPYRLVVEPLRPTAAEAAGFWWGTKGGCLLFLDDPDKADVGRRSRALQQIYGLTRGEAEVAEAIAAGFSPEEHAMRSGSRVSTVRTHLKRVFDKMGVGRQAALVGLVLRLPRAGVGADNGEGG